MSNEVKELLHQKSIRFSKTLIQFYHIFAKKILQEKKARKYFRALYTNSN